MSSKIAEELAGGNPIITATTVYSLLSTVAILLTAYVANVRLLPANAPSKTRILFIWHAFDGLIHIFLEGSFLYNCFFVYVDAATATKGVAGGASAYLSPDVYFLGQKDRVYGSLYATNPMGALWREYAAADARWGGSDLTVVSLELLTVFIGAPFALWVCRSLVKQSRDTYFWMSLLAAGELYGGFMTFAPEWLSGNPNLDSSNPMYLWVYLTFFNMLWVFFPLWALWEAHSSFSNAGGFQATKGGSKKTR